MGYCMELFDQDFTILAANKQAAFDLLKQWERRKLEKYPSLNECQPLGNSNTFEDALAELDWEAEIDEEGNIAGLCFMGEKLRDEDVWLDALAPAVEKGSKLLMRGEDGYLWCWYFNGESCTAYDGKVVFPDIPVEGKEQPICTM